MRLPRWVLYLAIAAFLYALARDPVALAHGVRAFGHDLAVFATGVGL
jgi:hypothetical protein